VNKKRRREKKSCVSKGRHVGGQAEAAGGFPLTGASSSSSSSSASQSAAAAAAPAAAEVEKKIEKRKAGQR